MYGVISLKTCLTFSSRDMTWCLAGFCRGTKPHGPGLGWLLASKGLAKVMEQGTELVKALWRFESEEMPGICKDCL